MSTASHTLIVLTTGKQDRGTRATLAFSWGCTSLAMGENVTLFLTMDGAVWGLKNAPKHVEVGGFEPLSNYIEQFLALGGELLLCAPCSEYYCSMGDDSLSGLHPEIQLAGLATIVAKSNKSKVVTM